MGLGVEPFVDIKTHKCSSSLHKMEEYLQLTHEHAWKYL